MKLSLVYGYYTQQSVQVHIPAIKGRILLDKLLLSNSNSNLFADIKEH